MQKDSFGNISVIKSFMYDYRGTKLDFVCVYARKTRVHPDSMIVFIKP